MFELVKWYLDLVTDLGTAVIGYSVDCRLGAGSFRYASLLHSPPDQPASERTTLLGARFPVPEGDLLRWQVPAFRFDAAWQRTGVPLEQTLLDAEPGRIEWYCRQPRALVTARLDDTVLTGLGYAERLRMTVPPWQLPFRTLRWGRYVSARHEIVWIEWEHDLGRRWLWLDGREEPNARLDHDRIVGLSERRELALDDRRVLRDSRVLTSLGQILPDSIRARVGPLAGMREQKWLAESELRQDGVAVDRGWALHEEVRW
jgi:hypothetical protein